ncbi:molybdopterin-dependent oxidoreductase [Thiohalobacter sp. IOR34]|uniref:nitrate reductase n=1 Tax=Thiohalobacter sp. IOR34 TaxID=3057176 RepID=UPI0025B075F7|nr:nitrate reductase [Thiohalobacter sp. IOR34]WJW76174.1 molybdopterin-dependent oxidoreductase [Thiohalobacter sp. IOR34]
MSSSEIKTTCPYCGVGCGVLVSVDEAMNVSVRGDPEHPANLGRLCSKGAALGETLGPDNRLLYPMLDGERSDWGRALDRVAGEFRRIIETHGPDAVAFYVSGQLLTEDYYVANKLMKGFIGSANIDTNSRLCMSSAVAGHRRAFGSDSVPCSYEDLERAKLIVLAGSNTAWCHPVLFQRIRRAKQDNPDLMVVVIDPRRTSSCDIADLHLALRPGSDLTLFNGLLAWLERAGEVNRLFVERCTEGAAEALAAAREQAGDPDQVARDCGLPTEQLREFYRLFARTERVVTVFSQGINQFSYGTDKVNAILNCHLATGRIGRPGMGPFSLTGQPNAMGGREVGGLANQLAAHMDIEDPAHRDRVQRFWDSPRIAERPGLKAVELFQAVAEGRVKALWIMATNPAVSLPDSNRVRAALEACEFLVVSDCVERTDTTAYADVLLPALGWGEKEGTVTNSERRISRQRAFLSAAGEARPDWWIVSEAARRMGFEQAFDYRTVAEVWREHAALSGFENDGARDFDISALAGLGDEAYDHLQPIQWPVTANTPDGTARLFGDGRFHTPSGRARLVAVGERRPEHATDADYPLVLNTGRVRDHWHTMTRTGKSPRLSGHIVEPYAELHPHDAARYGISDNGLVRLRSRWGEISVRARVSDAQQPGSVFVPMHWNLQFSSVPSVDCLVNPATDPVSGQPEFKHTPVAIEPRDLAWYGFILSRRRLELHDAVPQGAFSGSCGTIHLAYWVCAKGQGMWRYEIAGDQAPEDWARQARVLLCSQDREVDWLEYFDTAANRYRAARLVDGRLESCIFIGPDIELPSRDWLSQLFEQGPLNDAERTSLLTGKPAAGQKDAGHVVCACFGVGVNTLIEAIQEQKLSSVEEIGEVLKAGTNCGSCVPELKALLAAHH